MPRSGRDLRQVLDHLRSHIIPYATGNLHPGFMGWVHGSGTPVGMIAEMVAAGLNMNCGGRNHIGLEVEKQITQWMAEALGYPGGASGVFVTGSSMANFAALIVARTKAAGYESRHEGLAKTASRLTAYTSVEAHNCIARAMELAGLGSANLRTIDVDQSGRMDVAKLEKAVAEDGASGFVAFPHCGYGRHSEYRSYRSARSHSAGGFTAMVFGSMSMAPSGRWRSSRQSFARC